MAKFLYSAAMSLDGFISGPGGDMSWMVDHLGPNPVVDQLIKQTGAILVETAHSAATTPTRASPARVRPSEVVGTGRNSCWRTDRQPNRFPG
jgi:hypothetical protein